MTEETTSQQLVKKATSEGAIPPPFLQLATQIKDEAGNKKGVQGTGPHKVKFISDKIVKGHDYKTKEERDEVEYVFEEEGLKKRYRVPVKNKNGELHYFVQRMAEAKAGEEIILEYKKKEGSFEGYIDFKRAIGSGEISIDKDEIPIINEEEETQENPF